MRTAMLLLILTALAVNAQQKAKERVPPVNPGKNGVALRGYDPVAYFSDSKPAKGSESFTHQWNGVTWQFSSAANRDAFASQPERYAPQFGGYCAWAVSKGYTADADPEAWKVVDGKLYVNYNKDVQKNWEKEMKDRIQAAERNWPELHK